MLISQISVFVENKPGRLSQITGYLAEAAIDIRAFSIADTTDFGILRLIVSDPEKATEVLRANNVTVSQTQVIAVKIADQPGALHDVLAMIHEAGISVEYAYAFITRRRDDAYVIFRIENIDGAIAALQKAGVPFLNAEEAYAL